MSPRERSDSFRGPRAFGQSGDLFSAKPSPQSASRRRHTAPELVAARVLARQLARKESREEKQRIAHLICLNLRAMLNRGPQES